MKPLFCVILTLLFVNSITAQWNADPVRNTPVAKSALREYIFGEAIADGNGGSIIPIIMYDAGNNARIYAKKITADGELLWGDSVASLLI